MAWLAIVGAGVSALGSIQQGNEEKKAAKFNADILEQQAGLTRTSAELDIARMGKQKTRFVGSQKAGYSKAGVRVGTGSPLDVMADTLAEFELDEMVTRYNAEIQARGLVSESEQMRKAGKAAARAGYYKAGSTLLSTASSAYSQYGSKK